MVFINATVYHTGLLWFVVHARSFLCSVKSKTKQWILLSPSRPPQAAAADHSPARQVDRLVLHHSSPSPSRSLSSPEHSGRDAGPRPKAEGLSASLGLQRPETSRGRLARGPNAQQREAESPERGTTQGGPPAEDPGRKTQRTLRGEQEQQEEEEKEEEEEEEKRIGELRTKGEREEERRRMEGEEWVREGEGRERRHEEREVERRNVDRELEEEKRRASLEKERRIRLLREELRREEEEEERRLKAESEERVR